MNEQKNFIGSIFDFSFSSFITTKLIKFLYGASMVLSAIIAVILIFIGFSYSAALGIITLFIIAPIIFFVSIVIARVELEIIIVLFTIAENITKMVSKETTDI